MIDLCDVTIISIHALREEGDHWCGTRLLGGALFLSTPSVRRATLDALLHADGGHISIHALREEGDQVMYPEVKFLTNFYPRPP